MIVEFFQIPDNPSYYQSNNLQDKVFVKNLYKNGIRIYFMFDIFTSSDFKEIKCPDGSIRLVIRRIQNISKAVPLHLSEIESRFNGSLKNLQSISEAETDVEIRKKVIQTFNALDNVHTDAINKFAMVYQALLINPCDKETYEKFQKSVDDILKSVDKLRRIDQNIEDIKSKSLGTDNLDNDIEELQKSIVTLNEYY